jgi:aspartyl-tRNA(Asn)/glutamyl-tRNA(Gln) amidotransferase subunit C
MSLQREQVEKIAHLARIALSEDDIPRYTNNLSSIFDFVEQ